MSEFATWYIEFIQTLFEHIVAFFATLFGLIGDVFWNRPASYVESFSIASINFNLLDWVIGILVIIINFIFIGSLLYFVFMLLRRYFRFVRKEVSKDDLLLQIAELNQKIVDITDEKNAILTLKSGDLGL